MKNRIKHIIQSPIAKRIAFTIFILIIYRLLSFVTIPGVNNKELAKIANNSSLTMLSMFSGGSFDNFSIMSMGINAFITAQIIVQLLQSSVVSLFTQWSKEGQTGRRKLDQVTRTLTLILGAVQAVGITLGINSLTNGKFILGDHFGTYVVISFLMVTGTFIAMWLADQITDYGLGNGVSVIITAGILVRLPNMADNLIAGTSVGTVKNWGLVAEVVAGAIILLFAIVWFTRSEFRISIQYARRAALTGRDSYLPLKLIVPGVIPVIFGSSIMSIPQTLLMFFNSSQGFIWYRVVHQFFTLNTSTGVLIYGVLIITFTYIYSVVQIEPGKFSENLQRQEAYIPGIYPGKPTASYLKDTLFTIAFPGSVFLAVVSVLPLLAANHISQSLQIGLSGSSLLIISGVLIEIGRQIRGLRLKTEYGTFMNKDFKFDD